MSSAGINSKHLPAPVVNSTPVSPWSRMSSPWGKPASAPVPCSLEDVMSEQLAAEMDSVQHQQISETERKFFEEAGISGASNIQTDRPLSDAELAAKLAAEEVTERETENMQSQSDAELAAKLAAEEAGVDVNDELLARYLQREFDKEYDAMVDSVQRKHNGSSKVSISFENYKMKHQREEATGIVDEEDDDYDEEFPEFPSPTNWEGAKPTIGVKGYVGQGKNIVTKHDKVICGRRNAERLMEFPPEFESGDGEGMDMQLPNRVYNKLKAHSMTENKKHHKIHEKKEHSTVIKAVDEKTRILMFKLVNSGFLTSIDGVVSTGKEAVVFNAGGGMQNERELPKHVILKVFKTTMNEFRNRATYVYGDHRLSKDIYKKQNPRKIIKLWAEKEFMNLRRMRRKNLPCPIPLTLKKHILAMSCIGGEKPAPQLKQCRLSVEDLQDAYEQTVQIIKAMYHDCGLVHADLSEFNLLWHEGKVWVIDVSQAVEKENSQSHDFLLRDCKNVSQYFRDAGVHNVSTAEELFMEVTSLSMEGTGPVFVAQVNRYMKTDYPFDYFFEQSNTIRGQELVNDEEDSSSGEEEEVAAEGTSHTDKQSLLEAATTETETSKSNINNNSGSGSDRWVIECDSS